MWSSVTAPRHDQSSTSSRPATPPYTVWRSSPNSWRYYLWHNASANWLAFIDNTAGEAALRKGYGKDAFVNSTLAAFWETAARRGWRPRFTRVESKAKADVVSRSDLSGPIRNTGYAWTTIRTPSSASSPRRPRTPTTRRPRRWTT